MNGVLEVLIATAEKMPSSAVGVAALVLLVLVGAGLLRIARAIGNAEAALRDRPIQRRGEEAGQAGVLASTELVHEATTRRN